MFVRTTLSIEPEILKAAKRVALEKSTTLSALFKKALLVCVSDPDAIEETYEILMDRKSMKNILEAADAVKEKRAGYFVDWDKVRGKL